MKENIIARYAKHTTIKSQIIQMIIFVYNVHKVCIQAINKTYLNNY